MNVLFLADAVFDDLAGGSRVVVRELSRGLRDRGHDVTLLVAALNGSPVGTTMTEGVRIVRYANAGKYFEYLRAGQEACAKLCGQERFDVVHTHFAFAAVGPFRALPRDTCYVRTFHGPWDAEGWVQDATASRSPIGYAKAVAKRRMRYHIERANLQKSAAVSVLSDAFFSEVVNRFGVSSKVVEKIPGGVDTERFHMPKDRDLVRRQLDLPDDRQILLCVRRLVPRMGIDNLIEAMSQIIKLHPNALLLIGGKGPDEGRLQNLIDSAGLAAHCRLLGFIDDQQLVSYFQAADLFVLPTTALEGFGLVTVEALACGTPVIGTPVGGTIEILGPLDPALLTDGVSSGSLAKAISAYLDRPKNGRHNPLDIREYVLRNFRWSTHVERTEALYMRAMNREVNLRGDRQTVVA